MAVPAYPVFSRPSNTRNDLEFAKFTADKSGNVAIRTVLSDAEIDLSGSTFEVQSYTNGIYAAGTNPIPDNEGLVVCQNAAAPADINQIIRLTGGKEDSDALAAANSWGLDVRGALYGFNSATWDRLITVSAGATGKTTGLFADAPYNYNGTTWDASKNATALSDTNAGAGITLKSYNLNGTGIPVTGIMGYDSTVNANAYRMLAVDAAGHLQIDTDGYYILASNPIPDTEGLVVCQDAAAPAITDYLVRPTGGSNAADALVAANLFGINTRGLLYGLNAGGTWDRLTVNASKSLFTNIKDAAGNVIELIDVGAANTGLAIGLFDASGNRMPAMDATARPGYVKITDATTDVDVLPLVSATVSTGLLSVAGEIRDFDTTAADDPTPAIGIMGQSLVGAVPILCDATGRVKVDTSSNPIQGYGRDTTAVAGTPEQLTAAAATEVTIKALFSNTGKVYVGTNNAVRANNGFELECGESITIDLGANLNEIWLDVDVGGEGVSYIYS